MQMTDTALDMERLFLASSNVYPESPDPIHARWTQVLTHLPMVRGRHLLDDMTDAFEYGINSDQKDVIIAASVLSELKHRFVIILHAAQLTPSHVLQYSYGEHEIWMRRFFHKAFTTTPAHRKMVGKGKIRIKKTTQDAPYDGHVH